ncbi:MAG: Undecaprenyl-phosphate glucose phosphotransferase [Sphingobacteriales bacterium]|nr:Undecaprenyl-phosphate glucose phosphotransferase [Sphingobacteriales bacterium]
MENRLLYAICLILAISDLLIINGMFFFTGHILSVSKNFHAIPVNSKETLTQFNLVWLISSSLFQIYNKSNINNLEEIFRRTWKSLFMHLILVILSMVLLKSSEISRFFLGVFYSSLMLSFLASRFSCTLVEIIFIKHYKITTSVAVMGSNKMGFKLASFFEDNKKQYSFKGFLDENDSLFVDPAGNLLPDACRQIRKAAENEISEVYVSLTANRMAEAGCLLKEAERQCIRLMLVPDFSESFTSPFKMSFMGDFPVISLRTEPLENMDNRFKKRLFDIVVSLSVIVFVLSWLFPIVALIIKLESKGPVLFKQKRSGKYNKSFYCLKFRSMRLNAESDKLQARQNDARVTAFGKYLRRTSLDELPQFFNVLLGTMSVIGPRPHMLKHTLEYRAIIDKYMVRHHLKAGITGWAQINGYRGETNTISLMGKRIEHDIWYLEHWSLMLDLKILFVTIIQFFKPNGSVY